MVRRGRFLYLILGSLIVISQAANIAIALLGSTEHFRWLSSLLLPALMIWAVWNVWNTGDKWMRVILATWTLLKGLTTLWALAFILYRMAEITPPESTNFFVELSATLFTLPAIYACIFVAIGLTLFFSPSIREFLEDRSQIADKDSPFSSS